MLITSQGATRRRKAAKIITRMIIATREMVAASMVVIVITIGGRRMARRPVDPNAESMEATSGRIASSIPAARILINKQRIAMMPRRLVASKGKPTITASLVVIVGQHINKLGCLSIIMVQATTMATASLMGRALQVYLRHKVLQCLHLHLDGEQKHIIMR